MLMSAICTNQITDSIQKKKILTKSKLFPQYNFRTLALCLALLFKLASYIALLLVASYPLSDITVYICPFHPCMHDESS